MPGHMSCKPRSHVSIPCEGSLRDENLDQLRHEYLDRLLDVQRPAPLVGLAGVDAGIARLSIAELMRECEQHALTCRLVLIDNGHWAVLSYDQGNVVRVLFDWADSEGEREHLAEAVCCGAGPRFRISFGPDLAAWESSSIICIAELGDHASSGVPEPITCPESSGVTAVYPFDSYFDAEVTEIFRPRLLAPTRR